MRSKRGLFLSVAGVLTFTSIASANFVLSDGNSTVLINTASSTGVNTWMIDGVTQLAQQWFWYRTAAANPEAPINTLSAPVEFSSGNLGRVTYAAGGLSIATTFILTGGTAGSGTADLAEIIAIHKSAGLSGLSFFQYADFDLGGTPNDDSVQFTNANTVIQNDAGGGGWISETSDVPAPSHHQAAFVPTLLNALNDGLPTTLNDNNFAGPGNVSWAFQWDASGGTDLIISKDMHIQLPLVPEPTTLALLGLGTLLLSRRRNRA